LVLILRNDIINTSEAVNKYGDGTFWLCAMRVCFDIYVYQSPYAEEWYEYSQYSRHFLSLNLY
jgi:hypothetical protein